MKPSLAASAGRSRVLCLVGLWLLGLPAATRGQVVETDVCVYGGTSGGVVAAVQAARMGHSVVLVEPGRHLGGMTAGGLSAVDIGDPRSIGGIAREYFTRLAGAYGKTLAWDRPFRVKGGGPATGGAFAVEPHTAEALFQRMIREAKVPVHFDARLASVHKDGPRIVALLTEGGALFRAQVFLDTTYEGDLMAKAGVSYTLQREDRLPILPPPDYDPRQYEIVTRFIAACRKMGDDMDLRWFSKYDPLPNGKWDCSARQQPAGAAGRRRGEPIETLEDGKKKVLTNGSSELDNGAGM